MNYNELLRLRGEKIAQARALIDQAQGQGRDVTPSEETEIRGLREEVDGLARQLNEANRTAAHRFMDSDVPMWAVVGFKAIERDLERSLREPPKPLADSGPREDLRGLVFQDNEGRTHRALALEDRMSSQPMERWDGISEGSCGRILRARLLGDPSGLNEGERRAMGEGTGSLGGWLVPELVSSYLVDLARNKSVCMQAGGWTLPMDGPEITLVKVVSDPTSYWLKEGSSITESDGAFEPIHLKAIVLGCIVRTSVALLEDASNAGATLENMLASSLALELDRVGLFGNGSNEPRGLWECSGINEYSMGANGSTPTSYDAWSYAAQYVADDNGEATAVIMAPRTYYTLDRLKEGTTNAPLTPPPSYQALKKLVSNQIGVDQTQGTLTTSSCSFVGDFKNMVFGVRKNVTIEATRTGGTSTFANVQALIRAYMRVDLAILRENHFTVIKGIKA